MAKTDRCPICGVAVKPENLVRHLNDIHPRHPDTPRLKEQLRSEPGRTTPKLGPRPIHIRRWHVLVVVVIVLVGVGVSALVSSRPSTFPCVTGPLVYHWHARLSIVSASTPVTIPGNVGLGFNCAEPLHTHDESGQIHVETDVNRLYSIGDFFSIWGKSFGSPTQMQVNGTPVSPNPGVILYDQETVALTYASFG